MNIAWLGGLTFGREILVREIKKTLSSLPVEYQYVLDIADIYASGRSIDVFKDIAKDLPNNYKFSLKAGLTARWSKDGFGVDYATWDSLRVAGWQSWIESFGVDKIHSLQLHALPPDKEQQYLLMRELSRLKNEYNCIEIGVCNIGIGELEHLVAEWPHLIDFVQLHGNIIEQRLIREYKNWKKYSPGNNLYAVCNRVLCRGLLKGNLATNLDSQSRFNSSNRIRSYYTGEIEAMIRSLDGICSRNDIKLIELAIGWFQNQSDIYPILGARTPIQFRELINTYYRQDRIFHEQLLRSIREFESYDNKSYLSYPLAAFEQ